MSAGASGELERGYGDRSTRLRPPISPLMEEDEEISSGFSQWNSNGSRRAGPPSSSRMSALLSTASLEPTSYSGSSGSSGILAYHVRTGSIQNDSSSSYDSLPPSSSSAAPRPLLPASERLPANSSRRDREHWTPNLRHGSSCCKRLGRTSWKRMPRGVGSVIVFLLNCIESFAFYGAIDSTLRILFTGSGWRETALVLLVKFTAGRVMYPIAGFLSDVCTGRYRMIQIGIWLFWVAFALLSLCLALASANIGSRRMNTVCLPVVAYVLISAASGAIEVAIIPFGVDQLSQGASSHEQSSYFYLYYFGRQLGNLAGILSFYGLSRIQDKILNEYAVASIQSVVALVGMTVALTLLWWFKNHLFIDRQRENPLKEVVNVVFYAATVRDTPPVTRRAFRYGEGKKKRMDRAKYRYDGPYTSEEVEDVKTFCKILLILFSLGLCFMTYTGVYVLLDYEISDVQLEYLVHFPNLFSLWNSLVILVTLPVVNFVVLPCTQSWTMRERIGFGVALLSLSAIVTAYLEWCIFPLMAQHHQFLWLVLPVITVSLGEMLLFVTGLEFIYAQSPEQMKGFLTGLFYLMFGLFSGAASLFFYLYPVRFNHLHGHASYYTIYSVVGGIGFGMYVTVACLYSNRDRPEEDDFIR